MNLDASFLLLKVAKGTMNESSLARIADWSIPIGGQTEYQVLA